MDHRASRSSEEAILLQDARHHNSPPQTPEADELPRAFPGYARSTLPVHEADRSDLTQRETRDKLSRSDGWRRVSPFLPSALRRGIAALLNRIEGPLPPRPFQISPLGSSLIPIWRYSPRVQRLGTAMVLLPSIFYVAVFVAVVLLGTARCEVEGYGAPVRLSCTDQLWFVESRLPSSVLVLNFLRPSEPGCGLDGGACRPFSNASYAFRCPALCSRVRVLEPYTIGNETVNYRTLVIGGPTPDSASPGEYRYRGDSFLCPAAIHAGIIPDFSGGVGIIELAGEQGQFPSVSANGINSIGSIPAFPMSFTLKLAASTSFSSAACRDPRWVLLALTLLYSIIISLVAQSLPVFFAAILTSTFFCIGLAVDAPEPPSYEKVVSLAFEGFLPAAFVAYALYYLCVKRALSGLSGTMEQTVLWLGSFWFGALDNLTFDKLPVQRLIPHDVVNEPGAGIALLAILCVVIVAGVGQAWAFRIEGRLPHYLLLYLAMGMGILLLAMIPHLNLRIHHYIIALILLPGTALQTRPSLVYQGLLVGLFINGVARWGFASVLQIPEELFTSGLSGAPPLLQPTQMLDNNITFAWQNARLNYDSLSIMVNDVERFRGYASSDPHSFTWTRSRSTEPVFFRFAYTRHEAIGEITIGDYSNPGTWLPNNTWIPMIEGDAWSAI